jgi:ketosteroid isomerase-like protein
MNRTHLAPWFLLLAIAGLAGCEGTKASDPFPQAVADGWLGAFNSGDVAGLALMYSEDAQMMPPDEPVASGHAAIEAFWQTYNPGQVRIEVSEVDTRKLGEYWVRQGAYKAEFPDEGEPRVGKFIELWTNEGNNWLLFRQMWNRNAPPPAPSPEAAAADEPA